MKRKKIDLTKEDVRYIKLKTVSSSPLIDLAIEVDEFLAKVKHSKDISNEEKAKILNSYKKLLINLSDSFLKAAKRYNIEFKEPFSITELR